MPRKPVKPIAKMPAKKGLSNPKAAKGAAASGARSGNRSAKAKGPTKKKAYAYGKKNRPLR